MAEHPPGTGSRNALQLTRLLRLAFWLAVLWTGLSVFFASQIVLLRGVPWSIWRTSRPGSKGGSSSRCRPTTTCSVHWCRPSFSSRSSNAIGHGVARRLAGGHVEVTAERDGSVLRLRVRDNGVGLPSGWSLQRDAGVGLRNVVSRLEHLYGQQDLLRMVPRANGGIEVQVDLPLQPSASAAPLQMAKVGA